MWKHRSESAIRLLVVPHLILQSTITVPVCLTYSTGHLQQSQAMDVLSVLNQEWFNECLLNVLPKTTNYSDLAYSGDLGTDRP